MITHEKQNQVWIEGGFIQAGDAEWVSVSTILDSFVDAAVFVSLPDIAGDTSDEGYPAIARVRNVVASGQVSFEVRLYQANDSFCLKNWSIPQAIDPPLSLSWLAVERGAFNLTGKYFMIGSGNITRASAAAYDPINRHQYLWPLGCEEEGVGCLFREGSDVGIILQLQTTVNERILIPRVWNVGRSQTKIVLQPHDALDLDYYEVSDPEVLAYMSFEAGIDISCVEKLSFETWKYTGVTNLKMDVDFSNEYILPPGLFGTVGSPNSLGDSTGLRSFDLTTTGASFITQEDQCVDKETEHTTGETVFTFVMGERANISCVICKAVFIPRTAEPSTSPSNVPTSSLPTLSPTAEPTAQPSACPTSTPSLIPTPLPTAVPSNIPTSIPSASPTCCPTSTPTSAPSHVPTFTPTSMPSIIPTSRPTSTPTDVPSVIPSRTPSQTPTSSPTVMPTKMPTACPSEVPTVEPTMTPTLFPTFEPSCVPTSSPTTLPTVAPTPLPSTVPSGFPTSMPSMIPTPVNCENITEYLERNISDVINMITHEKQNQVWIEGGFIQAGDAEWVSVSTILDSFVDAAVFVSLPDIAGDTSDEGYPAIARVRNVVASGQVSFEVRLYQANDSFCLKNWSIPQAIDPPLSLSWLAVERGAFNLTGKYFMIGSGNITRASAAAYDPINRHQYLWPVGCEEEGVGCLFREGSDVGIILQLQTTVNERILIPRVWNVGRSQTKIVLQPHDALDLDYYEVSDPEVLAYMSFEAGIDISCVEKLSFETWKYTGVTNLKMDVDFSNEYILPPGLFGTVGSPNSLGDSTGLRSFDLTTTGASFITQEDQCVDKETEHTTGETVFTFVMGERANISCVICKAVFIPRTAEPSTSPSNVPTSSLPTLSPTAEPTAQPSACPTSTPSLIPTPLPTAVPSNIPTSIPSASPTCCPTSTPTSAPSHIPTFTPTSMPSIIPTSRPTSTPTDVPSVIPTQTPSQTPTSSPSVMPSSFPTTSPSSIPTTIPTVEPSFFPSSSPTFMPTTNPTVLPSVVPTVSPTVLPSYIPTCSPTSPTSLPSMEPTSQQLFDVLECTYFCNLSHTNNDNLTNLVNASGAENSTCLSITVMDLFGDGWDNNTEFFYWVQYEKSSTNVISMSLSCDCAVLSGCLSPLDDVSYDQFFHFTIAAADGDDNFIVPDYYWEMHWTVQIQENGILKQKYYAGFNSSMVFQYHVNTGTYEVVYFENLWAAERQCWNCSAMGAYVGDDIFEKYVQLHPPNYDTMLTGYTTYGSDSLQNSYFSTSWFVINQTDGRLVSLGNPSCSNMTGGACDLCLEDGLYLIRVTGKCANTWHMCGMMGVAQAQFNLEVVNGLYYASMHLTVNHICDGYNVTSVPSSSPTPLPSTSPSSMPTYIPTFSPSCTPTTVPSATPTTVPSSCPTTAPTAFPSTIPTVVPTSTPTSVPTVDPTHHPTHSPTSQPSCVPTASPTAAPTLVPSAVPTALPSPIPTSCPTTTPSYAPSISPTSPTSMPTGAPSMQALYNVLECTELCEVTPSNYTNVTSVVNGTSGNATTCLSITVMDLFGDGWDNNTEFFYWVQYEDTSSNVISMSLSCDCAVLSGCLSPLDDVSYDQFFHFTIAAADGDDNFIVPDYYWEMHWTVQIQENGILKQKYYAGFNSSMVFQYHVNTGTYEVVYFENLWAAERRCWNCSAMGAYVGDDIFEKYVQLHPPNYDTMLTGYTTYGSDSLQNSYFSTSWFVINQTDGRLVSLGNPSCSNMTGGACDLCLEDGLYMIRVTGKCDVDADSSSWHICGVGGVAQSQLSLEMVNGECIVSDQFTMGHLCNKYNTTFDPSMLPTSSPSFLPTLSPTLIPSVTPTFEPSSTPSTDPTFFPTSHPTAVPTSMPSRRPTLQPTHIPSALPSFAPTSHPSLTPSVVPTTTPTEIPTGAPTRTPTFMPTELPTIVPTRLPTVVPTPIPSAPPTLLPSHCPTALPTVLPTALPTVLPSNLPTASPTLLPSSSPSLSPTNVPSLCPTSIPSTSPTAPPTSVPTPLPTGTPTRHPTPSPTVSPTSSPTAIPTASPSTKPTFSPTSTPTSLPTVSPTSLPSIADSAAPTVQSTMPPSSVPTTCEGIVNRTSDVINMISGEVHDEYWLEGGFTDAGDQEWVSISVLLDTFVDAVVFISLPDIAGDTSDDGYPAIGRVRNVVTSGRVSFDVKLYQANDSFCSKEWKVPVAISPPVRLSWMVVEKGAWNLTGAFFMVGSGDITRKNSVVSDDDNFHRYDWPVGCVSSTVSCLFANPPPGDDANYYLGAILQLQTLVNDRLLIPRLKVIRKRFMRVVLQPHDSSTASYYEVSETEELGYMSFETNIQISCVEGISIETWAYRDVTNVKLDVEFNYFYATPPGLFGVIGTSTSLADATGLRAFSRTQGSASIITQEDQCVDEETEHTTGETVYAFVSGLQNLQLSCTKCMHKFTPEPTYEPSALPTHSPTSTPTAPPTSFPTLLPTVSPTSFPSMADSAAPTLGEPAAPSSVPTTCEGIVNRTSDVINMISGEVHDEYWLEGGFTDAGDQEWVSISVLLDTFVDAVVFISLPDIAGDTSDDGYPAIGRVRNVVTSGRVSFDVKLYQANDSFCSKEWKVPVAISPPVRLSWMVVEKGAWNLTGAFFMVGSGDITRKNSVVSDDDNFHRYDWPVGCVSSTVSCLFADPPPGDDANYYLGAILQLQTLVNDRLLIPRLKVIRKRFMRVVLQPHDSSTASYYEVSEAEELGYMSFETNIQISCVEGISIETWAYRDVTNVKLDVEFNYFYATPPGLFGVIGTSTSLADATGLRAFSRTQGSASIITQEDQCVDEETEHTTGETVYAFVSGLQNLQLSCTKCMHKFTPEPTYEPSALPTHSPTSTPTAPPTVVPTAIPSALPTSFPTLLPTVSPTSFPSMADSAAPTLGDPAAPSSVPTTCEGIVNRTSDVINMISGEVHDEYWLEGGFTDAGDQEWVSISVLLDTFVDAVVFISLPDIAGDTSDDGYPAIGRVRNVVTSGRVSFDVKLYQANDSFCSKEWKVPVAISPPVRLSWMVVEKGAWNLTGAFFMVGSGDITRKNSVVSDDDNFHRYDWPVGCVSSTVSCLFADPPPGDDANYYLGAILQLQTLVNDRLLIPRLKVIRKRFMRVVLQPHDSSTASYYEVSEAEELGYMSFETNIQISCVEGISIETWAYRDVTNVKLDVEFNYFYATPPGLFGVIGTSTSLADATGLRAFSRTQGSASIITQEDQCVDEETEHTTGETVYAFVSGLQNLQLSCTKCMHKFTPEPTYEPSALPTHSPTSTPTAPPTVVPTAIPSALPTSFPTLLPTVSPTSFPSMADSAAPTLGDPAAPSSVPTTCEGIVNRTSDVINMISGEVHDEYWLEGGFTDAGDQEWVSISVLLDTFVDAVVFISLPDIAGDTSDDGYPAIGRVRNVVTSGRVSFDVKLYQANDSFCSKEWKVPVAISPPVRLSWMVVEKGAWNLTGAFFMVGSGDITRKNSVVSDDDNFHRYDWPVGCVSSTVSCLFADPPPGDDANYYLGAILQLQTLVNDRLLIPRLKVIRKRFMRVVLQPHDSSTASYYEVSEAEELGYMSFETNIQISCVEGISIETWAYRDVTNVKLDVEFNYFYATPPGLFGVIGTSTSLTDATGLRAFSRTQGSASIITQEDQCVDEETEHTTGETVYAFVSGLQNLQLSCTKCMHKFTPEPTYEPSALPTHSPTSTPTAPPTVVPTAIPSALPTSFPTLLPTVSPTSFPSMADSAAPTLGDPAAPSSVPTTCEGIVNRTSDVINMISGEVHDEYWLEGGFTDAGDQEWVSISVLLDTFVDAVVFISLPDIAGDTSDDGYPAIGRVRNVVTSGRVSFDVKLYQANDSFCSKEWKVPVAISPPVRLSWMVVEKGAWNLTGAFFMVGSGDITRKNSVVSDDDNFHRYDWPVGCVSSTVSCLFADPPPGDDANYYLGAILQLQTLVNDRLLIPRLKVIRKRFMRVVLQPHDSSTASYYEVSEAEELGYMSFETNIQISCVEGISIETWAYRDVTNVKLDVEFNYFYATPPGLFGVIGTSTSLTDATGLRAFSRTQGSASIITQEDQCVDEETEHTTGETVYAFVSGLQNLQLSCTKCMHKFTPEPTYEPSALPTHSPTSTPTAPPTVVPTAIPSALPTSFPTLLPTVSPTSFPSMADSAAPTLGDPAAPSSVPTTCEGIVNRTSDVINMISGEVHDEYWLEGGFTDAGDQEWVSISVLLDTFVDAVVFISLPDIAGDTSDDGYPAIGRVRNVVTSGRVSFDVKLYQANDSFCSKEWKVPVAISPPVRLSWMVVEKGAWNLTGAFFMVGSGDITRKNSVVSDDDNFHRYDWPVGCVSSTVSCLFADPPPGDDANYYLGAILQLQTLVNDRLLIPRLKVIRKRFMQVVLQPHDSSTASYYEVSDTEELGYMSFETNIQISCVEGISIETWAYRDVTNVKLDVEFNYFYATPPGLFGVIGTSTSLADATGLRAFSRTQGSASIITQEDQCVDEETEHTTGETVYAFVSGLQNLQLSCTKCMHKFTPEPTYEPSALPTHSPTSVPTTSPSRPGDTNAPTVMPTCNPTVFPSQPGDTNGPTMFPSSLSPSYPGNTLPPSSIQLLPTVSPTSFPSMADSAAPTLGDPAAPSSVPTTCEGIVNRTSDVINMISGEVHDEYWLEGGFTDAGDQEWVSISVLLDTFVDAVVFISLPDIAGDTSDDGYPAIGRVRNVVTSGRVSFDVKLYQANDSFCSKEWKVPVAISPPVRLSWMVVEKGAWNLTGAFFMVGSGDITRKNSVVSDDDNFHRYDWPVGCVSSTVSCLFADPPPGDDANYYLGAILQLQTLVNDRLLIPRLKVIRKRFMQVVLQPHDSSTASYYEVSDAEELGYMSFETNIQISCVEGISIETWAYRDVTNVKLDVEFNYFYATPPGLFGVIGTSTSLTDATGLRAFSRTQGSASIITQEDQCVDEETEHTTGETVYAFVSGLQNLQLSCTKCMHKFTPEPTYEPSALPTHSPTSVPTTSPSRPGDTNAPTVMPTCNPTVFPSQPGDTNGPTMFPSSLSPSYPGNTLPPSSIQLLPTVSPTSMADSAAPTLGDPAAPSSVPTTCEGIVNRTSDVINMISGEVHDEYWLEGGFTDAGDQEWVSISVLLDTFVDAVVFISLPDIAGDTSDDGYPAIGRVRNVVTSGRVSFDVKLYQANDSFCSKEWKVPVAISPPVRLSWIVVEKGAWNLTGAFFMVGSGDITRKNSVVSDDDNFHRYDWPVGCVSSTVSCLFADPPPGDDANYYLGAILQLQTLVNDRLLIPRLKVIRKRFMQVVLQPHDSSTASYYEVSDTEELGYMSFETNIQISCVEGISIETWAYRDVTNVKLDVEFNYFYATPPGLFGVIGTSTSLTDATGLRAFSRTQGSASIITQEDQCVDEETEHTTGETVYAFVSGLQNLQLSCTKCMHKFTPEPTYEPSALPTHSPTSVPTTSPSRPGDTNAPTVMPTCNPTVFPSQPGDTNGPTMSPSSLSPSYPGNTASPTSLSTYSSCPSHMPTGLPTLAPSAPSPIPTQHPSVVPTVSPTPSPTQPGETNSPSNSPSWAPTPIPSSSPTLAYKVLCDLFEMLQSNVTYVKYCTDGVPNMQDVCSDEDSGITCDQSLVPSSIDLTNTGMFGPLPNSIGELSACSELHMSDNTLESPLPESIERLSSLEVLDLSRNNLGTIGLSRRRLVSSENITSDLIDSLAKLTSLKYLDISDNGLVGEVPDSLCDLNLDFLYLMDPANFSSAETNQLGQQYLSSNANNFTCIPRCFYGNPNDISLAVDYDLYYCRATASPTSEPTGPNEASSTTLESFMTTGMNFLIFGLVLFVALVLVILYYFCCFSNTKVKGRDEEVIQRASFIDIEHLKAAKHAERQSIRDFQAYLRDDSGNEDDTSIGEDSFNYMNPSFRHFGRMDNLAESDDDDENSSSNPSHSSTSNSMSTKSHQKPNKVAEGQNALDAWNEDLIDFHKGNVHIPELKVYEEFFKIPDAQSSSESDTNNSDILVPYRQRHKLDSVLGEDEGSEEVRDNEDDNMTYDTLVIYDTAKIDDLRNHARNDDSDSENSYNQYE